jgi:hypothetical protein
VIQTLAGTELTVSDGVIALGHQMPQGDTSDIDLLIEFDAPAKTFDNFMALSFFLEDLFDQKVEIVTKESLSPYIGPHILNEIEYVTIAA